MERYLACLDEDQQRSSEEYLGAFKESLKMILHQNPVDRIGNAVLLAAKTALRLKACLPEAAEHEIALRLQAFARSIRLVEILEDLTPEEKRMLKHPSQFGAVTRASGVSPARARSNHGPRGRKPPRRARA